MYYSTKIRLSRDTFSHDSKQVHQEEDEMRFPFTIKKMSLRYINSNSVFALTSVETVTCDVGGQLHRVTLAFLGMHQNVGFCRAAINGYNPFDTSPIFIDRDGDLFRHVIQYLRCGEIDLQLLSLWLHSCAS